MANDKNDFLSLDELTTRSEVFTVDKLVTGILTGGVTLKDWVEVHAVPADVIALPGVKAAAVEGNDHLRLTNYSCMIYSPGGETILFPARGDDHVSSLDVSYLTALSELNSDLHSAVMDGDFRLFGQIVKVKDRNNEVVPYLKLERIDSREYQVETGVSVPSLDPVSIEGFPMGLVSKKVWAQKDGVFVCDRVYTGHLDNGAGLTPFIGYDHAECPADYQTLRAFSKLNANGTEGRVTLHGKYASREAAHLAGKEVAVLHVQKVELR